MKAVRILSEVGFVLHTRPYRETSLLLEAFTKNYGRVSLVARGVRKKQAPQLFTTYDFSWYGRSDLYGLMRAENNGANYLLSPYQLCCGLYINELLLRVLQKEDPHAELYFAYESLLHNMQDHCEIALRLFEKKLLQALGYGFSFDNIRENQYYHFRISEGLIPVDEKTPESISGESLLALEHEHLEEKHLGEIKKLMRTALSPLIGDKPLRSRELFL